MTIRYVTDETLKAAIGDTGIDLEDLGQVLEDCEAVYRIVVAEPWLTEAALRSAAEEADIDPDRTNLALKVLTSSGRLRAVNLTEKQIPTPEEPASEESPPEEEPS
jgi:hypothetical protein